MTDRKLWNISTTAIGHSVKTFGDRRACGSGVNLGAVGEDKVAERGFLFAGAGVGTADGVGATGV